MSAWYVLIHDLTAFINELILRPCMWSRVPKTTMEFRTRESTNKNLCVTKFAQIMQYSSHTISFYTVVFKLWYEKPTAGMLTYPQKPFLKMSTEVWVFRLWDRRYLSTNFIQIWIRRRAPYVRNSLFNLTYFVFHISWLTIYYSFSVFRHFIWLDNDVQ